MCVSFFSRRRFLALGLVPVFGCSPGPEDGTRVRIGYLARLTHAPALTALESGRLEAALPEVRLEASAFAVGNSIVEALFARELDLAYLGPNPLINGFVRSGGAIRALAGATLGGAAFVVRTGVKIDGPGDLHGKRFGSPEVASTQDIALRRYLAHHGLRTTLEGGDVSVLPMSGPEIRLAFLRGEIDGAWLSEPMVSELELSANARVFLLEAEEWPEGRHPTTLLAVRRRFCEAHPGLVARYVRAHVEEIRWIRAHSEQALGLARRGLERALGQSLPEAVARRAFARLEFESALEPRLLLRAADDAREAGFLPAGSLAELCLAPGAEGA